MDQKTRTVAEGFAKVATQLHDEPDIEQTLDKVLEYSLIAVGCDQAGVMFVSGGRKVDPVAVTDAVVAHVLARHASVALATARHEENLNRAIDARHLVGMAQGILMQRFDLDEDQSFAVLRRYSQSGNVKLGEVARRVIAGRNLPAD